MPNPFEIKKGSPNPHAIINNARTLNLWLNPSGRRHVRGLPQVSQISPDKSVNRAAA